MKKFLLILLICSSVFLSAWTDNPDENTPVAEKSGNQVDPEIVSDGNGGCYIAWRESSEVRLIRLAPDGTVYKGWPDEGVLVTSVSGTKTDVVLASGDGDGVYIAWECVVFSYYRILVITKYSPEGTIATGWENEKRLRMSDSIDDRYAWLCPDENGGVYAIWWAVQASSSYLFLVIDGFNSEGEHLWHLYDGLRLRLSGFSRELIHITTFDNESALVCWGDQNGVYALRVNNNGEIPAEWPSTGKRLVSTGINPHGIRAIADGLGNAYIVWTKETSPTIQAIRINQNGEIFSGWESAGTAISTSATMNNFPGYAIGNDGALYVAWPEDRYNSFSRIYLQRLTMDGNISVGWDEDGLEVGPNSNEVNQYDPRIIQDEDNGVYVLWKNSDSSENDLYAQRIDDDGSVNLDWDRYGVPFCIADNTQHQQYGIQSTRGGIIVAWSDYRNGIDYDIYAQKICPDSSLGLCEGDNIPPIPVIETNCNGSTVPFNITFDGSASTDPDGTVEEYEWIMENESWNTMSFIKSFTVSPQRFYTTGDVTLWVRDNTGDWAKTVSPYYIFPTDTISLEFRLHPRLIKARGKGMLYMEGVVITNAVPPLGQWDPFLYDLGLKFTVDNGTLSGDPWFEDSTGSYYQEVISGTEGTARLCCYLCGLDEFCLTATYYWPQPPINILAEVRLERSLFLSRYYSTITWEANPDQVYPPLNYNIYRYYNSGEKILTGVVPATQFTYSEFYYGPPASSYAITSIDYDGDESDPEYVDITIVNQ